MCYTKSARTHAPARLRGPVLTGVHDGDSMQGAPPRPAQGPPHQRLLHLLSGHADLAWASCMRGVCVVYVWCYMVSSSRGHTATPTLDCIVCVSIHTHNDAHTHRHVRMRTLCQCMPVAGGMVCAWWEERTWRKVRVPNAQDQVLLVAVGQANQHAQQAARKAVQAAAHEVFGPHALLPQEGAGEVGLC